MTLAPHFALHCSFPAGESRPVGEPAQDGGYPRKGATRRPTFDRLSGKDNRSDRKLGFCRIRIRKRNVQILIAWGYIVRHIKGDSIHADGARPKTCKSNRCRFAVDQHDGVRHGRAWGIRRSRDAIGHRRIHISQAGEIDKNYFARPGRILRSDQSIGIVLDVPCDRIADAASGIAEDPRRDVFDAYGPTSLKAGTNCPTVMGTD